MIRKVPLKYWLGNSDIFVAHDRFSYFKLSDSINKQKRVSMR